MQTITVAAPASVANVVCGFDVLGFALSEPYDLMTVSLLEEPVIQIKAGHGFDLPTNPADNVAGAALLALQAAYEKPIGFSVSIDKRIKPGSGIGSSAASAAGAVVAANKLLNDHFTKTELVWFAMHGEAVASGAMHADNVAPCIFGSMTLVRSLAPLDVVCLPVPELYVTIVHPQIELRTADMRAILPQKVDLKDAIKQWGNVAGLVAGILQKDYGLIGRSLEDYLIEPIRSILIPGFEEVKRRSLAAGALGGGISGSGPSIFMLSRDLQTAQAVEQEMAAVFAHLGLDAHTYVTTVNTEGVRVAG